MGVQAYLNFPLDAVKVVAELADKPCEVRFWHTATNRVQPCSQVNPCLTCRARNAHREIRIIESYTNSGG